MKQLKILNYNLIDEQNKSCILEKIGLQAAVTDFASLQGADVGDFFGGLFSSKYLNNVCSPENKTGSYFVLKNRRGISCINSSGFFDVCNLDSCDVSTRIVLDIDSDIQSVIDESLDVDKYGIKKIKYLEYPQDVVSSDLNIVLEDQYNDKNLSKIDNSYLFKCKKIGNDFMYDYLEVYEYENSKYVRVKFPNYSTLEFSNGDIYNNASYVWVEVKPIEFYVDSVNNFIISEKSLFSGFKFSYENKFVNYDSSDLNYILNNKIIYDLYQNKKNFLSVVPSKKFQNIYFSERALNLLNFLENFEFKKSAHHLNKIEKLKVKAEKEYVLPELDFSLLSKGSIFGIRRLPIFDSCHHASNYTDFAILMGGMANLNSYWLTSSSLNGDALYVASNGKIGFNNVDTRSIGVRPIFSYKSKFCKFIKDFDNGFYEFGFYPQNAVFSLGTVLEEKINEDELGKTNFEFTIDKSKELYNGFSEEKCPVYLFCDKYYVRIISPNDVVINNNDVKCGDVVWFEVSPIKWIYDREASLFISHDILFSGIQYNLFRDYDGNFIRTDLKYFMDKYFEKDMLQFDRENLLIDSKGKKLSLKK